MSASETAKMILGEKHITSAVIEGSEGEKAIDISKLRGESGFVTLDNGFMNTAACTSAITFLDGEKGILRYRGYPIEQLAEKSTFEEVAFLLLSGNLPKGKELENFKQQMHPFGELPAPMVEVLKKMPSSAHPMGILSGLINLLSAFYPQYLRPKLLETEQAEVIGLLMAQVKALAVAQYRYSHNKTSIPSSPKLGYAADFANMMFGGSEGNEAIDPVVMKALDILFILHADHEQNCSTSTVRMVGSSLANVFASVAAGVNALWGPSHGGANQAVIEMLEQIKADGGGHKKFIELAKNKDSSFRIMGFGHRVYKNFDPRAKIIKKVCDDILEQLGVVDPILDIAKGLEEEALKDPYFVERKLYPNVDFYSGIIFKALGIPTEMFTVMFALGRLPGWLAQWKELLEGPVKIGRPRQIYTGENRRDYVDFNRR